MSYLPTQQSDQCFFTLVRGNTSWNDVIEGNTNFIESSGDTVQTKNNLSTPMLCEGAISYESSNSSAAATWAFSLNSADSQFLWGQFRGWHGGAYIVGDDKALSTNSQSFTYHIQLSAGTDIPSFTRNNSFSSLIIFFTESI